MTTFTNVETVVESKGRRRLKRLFSVRQLTVQGAVVSSWAAASAAAVFCFCFLFSSSPFRFLFCFVSVLLLLVFVVIVFCLVLFRFLFLSSGGCYAVMFVTYV